jgi:polar amino acid transport system substrate-binding protein
MSRCYVFLAVCLAWLPPALHAERITIAAEDDWAPYSAKQANNPEPVGFTPELVREVFASQGIEVEFITVPFARCLLYAQTGRAVACFNVTITDANRDEFYWHPTPMFHEGLAIFALRGRFKQGLNSKDLEHHSVGITNAYTYPTDFMHNPKITRATTTSDGNLLRMLVKQRFDFIVLNSLPGQLRILDAKLGRQVEKVGMLSLDGFWLSFSKRHPEGQRMANLFERGLQELKQSGRFAQLELQLKTRIGLRAPQDAQAGE